MPRTVSGSNRRTLWRVVGLCIVVGLVFLWARTRIRDAEERSASLTIGVSAAGRARALPPYFLGYNASLARWGSWREPSLLQAVQGLAPGAIRFPGGTTANYWDWRSGWFKSDIRGPLPHDWDQLAANPCSLADLALACRETGALPILVVNMLTGNLQEQMEMLREAARLGIEVRLIEMGNEFYFDRELYVKTFPSASDYAHEAMQWRKAILEEFPGANIAFAGSLPRPGDSARRRKWNRRLLATLPEHLGEGPAPAVTFHAYTGTGFGPAMALWRLARGLHPGEDDRPASGMMGSDLEQRAQTAVMMTRDGVGTFLGMPFEKFRVVGAEIRKLPEGMNVWITEYNLFDRVGPIRHTWMHGLHSATMTLLALGQDRIELVCFHSLVDAGAFGALWTAQSVKDRQGGGEEPRYFPTASGLVLSMLADAMKGRTVARRLNFERNPSVSPIGVPEYAVLTGWLFEGGNGQATAAIVNLGAEALTVDLTPLIGRDAVVVERWGIPWERPGPDQVLEVSVDDGRVPVKAYSITTARAPATD